MEGWKSEVLSDVINLVSGGTPSTTNEDFWNGEIPWLSVDDFNTSKRFVYAAAKKISEIGLKNSATKLLDVGDVIISARGTVGVIAQLGSAMAFNQSCYGIKQKVSELSIDFIYYYLLYYFKSIGVVKSGSTFDTITKKTFDEILISFPISSSEQYKISTILSTIDYSIDQTEQLIAKYKNIKQGLMHDLLTFGIDQNGTIRNPQTHTFVEKKGMMVPEEWDVDCLGICCTNFKSGNNITAENIFQIAKYPVYGGNGLRGYTNNFTHSGKYVLIGRQGALCGNINIISGENYISEHAIAVQVNTKNILDYWYYKLDYLNLNQYSAQSAQPGLAVEKLVKLIVSIPKPEEQNKIAEILKQQGNLIESEQINLSKLQKLKQGLMQDLLTGKVRVV